MKKLVVALAVLSLGAGLARAQEVVAQEIESGDACLFEVEGVQILEVAMLDSIVGGRQICDSPNEKPYVDKSNRQTQNREGVPTRGRDNYVDPDRYAVSAPLSGAMTVTSPTGPRDIKIGGVKISGHTGTDLRASVGTPVSMVKTGLIEKVIPTIEFGEVIVTRNVDGSSSTYMHVVSARTVVPGSFINSGTKIATIGEAGVPMKGGILSTGPHLHYAEQSKSGEYMSTSGLFQRFYDPCYGRR